MMMMSLWDGWMKDNDKKGRGKVEARASEGARKQRRKEMGGSKRKMDVEI